MNPFAVTGQGRATHDASSSLRAEALDTSRQFEQIFIQQMLEGMRKSADIAGGEGLFGDGPGNDTYTQWFDNHLSEHLARSGDLGIAETLMAEFERWHQIPVATSRTGEEVDVPA